MENNFLNVMISVLLAACVVFSIYGCVNGDNYANNDSSIAEESDSDLFTNNSSFNDFSVESSDVEPNNSNLSSEYFEPDEVSDEQNIEHGWVINEYGYTYLYDGCGYLQFNYKNTTLQRYINDISLVAASIPENTRIFNIVAPVSSTFAAIPRDIYVEDNFYNLSQSAFVATASAALPERIINVPVITALEDLYDAGEYVFFRTDSNWTSLAAYTAYSEFCSYAGMAPYSLSSFSQNEGIDFLGSFYNATKSEVMARDPDEIILYFPPSSIGSVLKVYDNGTVFTNYDVCLNPVELTNAYDVFLGRDAGRYEINTNGGGSSLLVISDSSIAPMVPFLMAHYSKIDIISPEKYKGNLNEFLSVREFDDVILMCYSTNAVSGDYMPAINELIGEPING